MKRIIVINFKTYEEATSDKAIKLVKICKDVSKIYNVKIFVVPQFTDIEKTSKLKIPTLAQHIDPIEPDKHTGYISPYAIKKAGAIGTFLNHSEKKLALNEIEISIKLAKNYNLLTFCFVATISEAVEIAKFHPDFLIYEPPELVGTGVSVSKTKPDVITKFVENIRKFDSKIKLLCGAGITNGEDVKIALKLGVSGVVLSSGFVKSKNPKKTLEELSKSLISETN